MGGKFGISAASAMRTICGDISEQLETRLSVPKIVL